ncbi:MAG: protoheme IX farnesyltransferase [Bacteroidetes bacterium]|nr:MAG: protoheme IX farnesyltransferase [Bacteroidota bacterium]
MFVQSKTAPPVSNSITVPGKLADYAAFIKLRLASLVVFSAALGFLIVAKGNIDWAKVSWLTLAGFLVTGSANGLNQIIERVTDKVMDRTRMRPVPQERMSVSEATILASTLGISGLIILWIFLNPLSCLLSGLSILLYVGAYTPLKKTTAFAILVGALPGAFPPLLGAISATDNFGNVPFEGLVLFAIQFVWQFPHFWAIAWVMDEDYKKAGFRLLPSGERNKASAFQILVYTLFLLLMSMVPVFFGMTHTVIAPIIILFCGLFFFYQAVKLYRDCSVKSAREVMFGSFAYLPFIQLAILFG